MNPDGERRSVPVRRERGAGEGGSGWSPAIAASSRDAGDDRQWLEEEVGALERTLRERGDMRRRELAAAVDGRTWGPGRFRRALREAVRRQAIGRPARGRYGPSPPRG